MSQIIKMMRKIIKRMVKINKRMNSIKKIKVPAETRVEAQVFQAVQRLK